MINVLNDFEANCDTMPFTLSLNFGVIGTTAPSLE
jgi:hypothetical protein